MQSPISWLCGSLAWPRPAPASRSTAAGDTPGPRARVTPADATACLTTREGNATVFIAVDHCTQECVGTGGRPQASPGALPAARPLRVRYLVLLSPLVALASALVGSARAAPNEARIRLDDAACYLWGSTQWNRYCPA